MHLGIFARTFPGDVPAAVLAASTAAGFDGVQYNMACSGLPSMPEEIPERVAEDVAKARRLTGQQIFALSATFNMAHPDAAHRQDGLARLDVLASACTMMGAGLVTLCTGTRDPDDQWKHHAENRSPEAWADMLASFEVAVKIAEAHDILLGVEPELANVVDSAPSACRLIQAMASDRVRIVLDPANLFEVAAPAEQRRLVEEAVDLLGDRIVMAHAKDRKPDGSFAAAGKGVIDYVHFCARLDAAGFDGPLVTHGLAADEAADVAVFLRQLLPVC